MSEDVVLESILRYIHDLTCFNCGEKLIDVSEREKPVGVLWIDPGVRNYPREPDEPATAYFECMNCYEESQAEGERCQKR